MTRTPYPGGSYVDAMPSGVFAVLFPNAHIETHAGRITLPPNDQPLYHRISDVGGFVLAGQAHHSLQTWEYVQGAWRSRRAACGVSPVIYDRFGVLHISDCSIGSQGYRYVAADGRLVSGDETYGSPFGLSEWSEYGGLVIGQGNPGGGCLVWDGAVLRVLEAGDCRFIRVQGEGERVSIAFVKPDQAVIWQATLNELRSLPPVHVPSPQPPAPNPQPKPEPVPVPSNHLATVQRIRAKYPTPLADRHWEFLVEVAQTTGAKLYRKDGGTRIRVPPLDLSVSQDIVILEPEWVDILRDGEGDAVAIWDPHPNAGSPEKWIDVSGVALPGAPLPNPGIPIPNPGTLEARVEAIERWIRRAL